MDEATHDFLALRAEWLKVRGYLYDPNTGLPNERGFEALHEGTNEATPQFAHFSIEGVKFVIRTTVPWASPSTVGWLNSTCMNLADAGIVTFRHEAVNQRDEVVCRCERAALLRKSSG